MVLVGLRACHWADFLAWKIFGNYIRRKATWMSVECAEQPVECFLQWRGRVSWSKWQKAELYWNKFTIIFNSVLAHSYLKSFVCICFLFTIQEQTSPWWIQKRTSLPSLMKSTFLFEKFLLRKWKYAIRRGIGKSKEDLCVLSRGGEKAFEDLWEGELLSQGQSKHQVK